jgi:hypothetical protein
VGILFSMFSIPIAISFITQKTLKYASIFLIILGLYLEGGLAINNEYLQRAEEWNHKVEVAEEKAKIVNENVRIEYIDRVRNIEKIKYIQKDKIQKRRSEIDDTCKVTPITIEIHNDAAKGMDK